MIGGVDSLTGLPYLQASVEINRQEVDARLAELDQFSCQCYATGGSSASDSAIVSSLPGSTATSALLPVDNGLEVEDDDEDDQSISSLPSTSDWIRSETAKIRVACELLLVNINENCTSSH